MVLIVLAECCTVQEYLLVPLLVLFLCSPSAYSPSSHSHSHAPFPPRPSSTQAIQKVLKTEHVNCVDEQGMTPLLHAMVYGNPAAVISFSLYVYVCVCVCVTRFLSLSGLACHSFSFSLWLSYHFRSSYPHPRSIHPCNRIFTPSYNVLFLSLYLFSIHLIISFILHFNSLSGHSFCFHLCRIWMSKWVNTSTTWCLWAPNTHSFTHSHIYSLLHFATGGSIAQIWRRSAEAKYLQTVCRFILLLLCLHARVRAGSLPVSVFFAPASICPVSAHAWATFGFQICQSNPLSQSFSFIHAHAYAPSHRDAHGHMDTGTDTHTHARAHSLTHSLTHFFTHFFTFQTVGTSTIAFTYLCICRSTISICAKHDNYEVFALNDSHYIHPSNCLSTSSTTCVLSTKQPTNQCTKQAISCMSDQPFQNVNPFVKRLINQSTIMRPFIHPSANPFVHPCSDPVIDPFIHLRMVARLLDRLVVQQSIHLPVQPTNQLTN